ncbi:MAG TPA: hypothetical protein VLF21_00955 [Candidatus Saccharimonadales bacterium]|nr:hypothetical protein [Candidatus Saccharimonadales bacterium]
MRRIILAGLAVALLATVMSVTNGSAQGSSLSLGNVVNLAASLVVTNGGGQQPSYQRLQAVSSITWDKATGKVTIKGGPLAGARSGDYSWLAPMIESATGMEDGRVTKGASGSVNQRWPVYFRLTRSRVVERYSCSDNPYGVESDLLAKSYDTARNPVATFCAATKRRKLK